MEARSLQTSVYPPMILSLPPGQGPTDVQTYLANNANTVELLAPGNVSPILNWTFNSPGILDTTSLNEPSYPAAIPNGINFAPTNSYTYINTGQHLLFAYDYAYDADCGAIGFRPANPPPPTP